MGLLGRKTHTAGNTIRYAVDYSNWLDGDETLVSGTVTKSADSALITDFVISGVAATPSQHLVFLLAGGSVNETFTVNVQGVNSRGEVKNDTATFTVVAA